MAALILYLTLFFGGFRTPVNATYEPVPATATAGAPQAEAQRKLVPCTCDPKPSYPDRGGRGDRERIRALRQ